jgi:hypothetical protein
MPPDVPLPSTPIAQAVAAGLVQPIFSSASRIVTSGHADLYCRDAKLKMLCVIIRRCSAITVRGTELLISIFGHPQWSVLLDGELLAAIALAPRLHDLRRLRRYEFAFYGANQCLGFLETQTNVARRRTL